MRHIGCDVSTVGFGACFGMSGFLLAVGKKASKICLSGGPPANCASAAVASQLVTNALNSYMMRV
jgi:hypothetical protein